MTPTPTPPTPSSAPSAAAPSAGGAASTSAAAPGRQTGGSAPQTSARGADPNANSDAYAWKHDCVLDHVKADVQFQSAIGATRRVVAVTNTGTTACGLSYYPLLAIGDSRAPGDTYVHPTPPGGLGGAPNSPVYAGRTVYSVVDLNPSRSSVGATRTANDLDVLPSDAMPNAATTNHALVAEPAGSGNPEVHNPVVSLYYASVATAASMLGKS